MLPDPETIDLAELSERADVSVRTIRYYIQQGLLPAPESRGPGAHYGIEHLDRLRLVRRLQREHLPLAEIRKRLEALGLDEIRRLAAEVGDRPRSSARDYIRGVLSEGGARLEASAIGPAAPLRASPPAPAPMRRVAESRRAPLNDLLPVNDQIPVQRTTRSQWDRITLAPDVELHLRRPLSREQNRQVERLLEAARNIFEEDVR